MILSLWQDTSRLLVLVNVFSGRYRTRTYDLCYVKATL
jgi:hypothetical protein